MPAECALLPGEMQRLAQLAKYLALADHHGVQAARHGQQVLHRSIFVMHVQARRQLGGRYVRVPGQKLADGGHGPVELADLRVDLDPVAGAED